ncbi:MULTISPECIES: flavin reductase family protein [Paraburkholderia]|uniref:flavin reductase family protein n=1 Tax=Paraburkholderia TaxID=1822464 RepID=UPI000A01AAF3|nr:MULTISPECIES: flavin reductase family protein [Paraburkholderia]MDH6147556.1 flavin reductase (DIM6/NTAB) family NADH-FMN oxidoreductase RutF [Paraburkholderia sp. WSM4179]
MTDRNSMIGELEFRDAMSRMASTVCVLTARNGDDDVGITVTSVQAVSDSPALLLACVNTRSRLIAAMETSGLLGVSVLDADDVPIARSFARPGRGTDEFDPAEWRRSASGIMVMRHAITIFECSVEKASRFGTHLVVVGMVRSCVNGTGSPLMYCNREFSALTSATPLSFA